MQQYNYIFVYGFAIFAMFFGSGNLVFPIQIGYLSGSNWLLGFLGLFITGILLPFLGLFVIKLYKGSYSDFFKEAGGVAGVLIPLFALSLLGSFAVVPRCIIVAYGSISHIFPSLTLAIFSAGFCILTFFFCVKDKVMLKLLGKWMSPILLIVLSILIVLGIYKAGGSEEAIKDAFIKGFITGYQTMDLLAAFFFSSFIFYQIQDRFPKGTPHKKIISFAIYPSIIGALLLALIYLGFVFLGAHYSDIINDSAPEFMLPNIVIYIMGDNAAIFVAIAMLLSCLTTAVALSNIYSRYICLSLKITDNKFWIVLLSVIGIAFFVSLLDFKGIANFLAPVLEILYPGLIALTILGILFRGYKKMKVTIFYGISFIMLMRMAFFG